MACTSAGILPVAPGAPTRSGGLERQDCGSNGSRIENVAGSGTVVGAVVDVVDVVAPVDGDVTGASVVGDVRGALPLEHAARATPITSAVARAVGRPAMPAGYPPVGGTRLRVGSTTVAPARESLPMGSGLARR